MITFRPVRTLRTFEEAVEQIAEAIRVGDLRAGERLPSERVLAAQMEISRPTLREAIRVLSEAGVVTVAPGPAGGMTVATDFVPAGLVEERSVLRLGEVAGVLETRRLFEPRVAQLAALYATDEDFEAMRQTIELQRGSLDDRARFTQLDLRFHVAIARATRNETVVSMMRLLLHRLAIARDMALRGPHEGGPAITLHERTLTAITGGDPDEIEAVMDEHLGYLERIWEEETGRPLLRRPPDFLLPRAHRAAALAERRPT